ncbi:hypothetical protein ACPYO6_15515 [Georgenia sp. Z1344]|uniref:hypothetical protein n=1 Tax=Georgenia sp. Z1344 TaxID=3416706 RepID=UPI003CF0A695
MTNSHGPHPGPHRGPHPGQHPGRLVGPHPGPQHPDRHIGPHCGQAPGLLSGTPDGANAHPFPGSPPVRGPWDDRHAGRRPWLSAAADVAAVTATSLIATLLAATLASLLIDEQGDFRLEGGRRMPEGDSGAALTATTIALVLSLVVLRLHGRWRDRRDWYEGRGDARSMSPGACLGVDLVESVLLVLPPALILLTTDVRADREVGLAMVSTAAFLHISRALGSLGWAAEPSPRTGDSRPLVGRGRGATFLRVALAVVAAAGAPLVGLLAFDDTDFIHAGATVTAVMLPIITFVVWLRSRTRRPHGTADPTMGA